MQVMQPPSRRAHTRSQVQARSLCSTRSTAVPAAGPAPAPSAAGKGRDCVSRQQGTAPGCLESPQSTVRSIAVLPSQRDGAQRGWSLFYTPWQSRMPTPSLEATYRQCMGCVTSSFLEKGVTTRRAEFALSLLSWLRHISGITRPWSQGTAWTFPGLTLTQGPVLGSCQVSILRVQEAVPRLTDQLLPVVA